MNAHRYLPLLALFAAPLALAHPGHADASFSEGFLHPLSGADHWLAMLAVGLWSAGMHRSTGSWRALSLPLAFVAALAAGVWLGAAGLALPALEGGIALSLLALGAAAFALPRLPQAVAVGVAALVGLWHGHAHGIELHGDAITGAGIVLASVLLHLCGAGLGLHPLVRRAMAAAVALAGVAFMLQLN